MAISDEIKNFVFDNIRSDDEIRHIIFDTLKSSGDIRLDYDWDAKKLAIHGEQLSWEDVQNIIRSTVHGSHSINVKYEDSNDVRVYADLREYLISGTNITIDYEDYEDSDYMVIHCNITDETIRNNVLTYLDAGRGINIERDNISDNIVINCDISEVLDNGFGISLQFDEAGKAVIGWDPSEVLHAGRGINIEYNNLGNFTFNCAPNEFLIGGSGISIEYDGSNNAIINCEIAREEIQNAVNELLNSTGSSAQLPDNYTTLREDCNITMQSVRELQNAVGDLLNDYGVLREDCDITIRSVRELQNAVGDLLNDYGVLREDCNITMRSVQELRDAIMQLESRCCGN